MEKNRKDWEEIFKKYPSPRIPKIEKEKVIQQVKEKDEHANSLFLEIYAPMLVHKYIESELYQKIEFDEYFYLMGKEMITYIQTKDMNTYDILDVLFSRMIDRRIQKLFMVSKKKETKLISLDEVCESSIISKEETSVIPVLEKYLNPKYIGIVCDFFGIGTLELSMKEIASKYQITSERVRQILIRFKDIFRYQEQFHDLVQAFGYSEIAIQDLYQQYQSDWIRLGHKKTYPKESVKWNIIDRSTKDDEMYLTLQACQKNIYEHFSYNLELMEEKLSKNEMDVLKFAKQIEHNYEFIDLFDFQKLTCEELKKIEKKLKKSKKYQL